MNCGNQFVETLRKIGYPKAAQLNGEDFDWLFETEEDKSFLEWFCGNVSEQHVLAEKELQAFDALLKSGKPILEAAALDEVLTTCKTLDSKSSGMEEEEEEVRKLQEEFQALQKIKNLKIHRRNKLQVMASTNSHTSLKLNDKAEEAAKILKEEQGIFTAINTKLNNELHSFTDRIKKLTFFFKFSDSEQGLRPHPVFLSQLALDKYLCQEEESTAALTSYTKKQFFQGISELVESSNEENFQLVDISKPLICDESNEVCKERLEMARLQMAYICAQHQLIQLKATDLSINSAVQWAETNLQSLKNKTFGKEENFEARISSLNSEISNIKKHLTQINDILPSLVKENAQLLNMPVVKGDFDLQIARQDYYTSRQDQVCDQLLKQKASFELLQLAYEIELRKHRDIHHLLENIIQDLKQNSNSLERRLEMMSEPLISQHAVPRNTIDSRDDASHRLYKLLEGETQKQQLFRTHKGMEQLSEKLKQDISSVQDRLSVASQEQSLFLSKLDSDLDALCDSLYCGGNQILLSNQELTEQLYQLEANVNKLNQLIMDLLADRKAKRKVLETNMQHQMERKLYVYFFKDEDYLKDIVEKLEHQSQAQTIGLED